MSDDDFEPGWPPAPPDPPTERDGLRVGDEVILIGMPGQQWPVRIVGFTWLPCDLVVEWKGMRPSLNERSTICRKHVREIRLVPDGDSK